MLMFPSSNPQIGIILSFAIAMFSERPDSLEAPTEATKTRPLRRFGMVVVGRHHPADIR
jgi:hypothetical protein